MHSRITEKVLKIVRPKAYRGAKTSFSSKFVRKFDGGHSWNQVKIGDTWFNCDPTNISNPEHALFSDKEFKTLGDYYYPDDPSKKEECNVGYKIFLRSIGIKSVHTLKRIKKSIEMSRRHNEDINI